MRNPAERSAQQRRGEQCAQQLREPIERDSRPGEVTHDREGERHGRVEMCAGDVPDRVDHHHDHEAERDRDADVPECSRLRVDHHRAGAGENESKSADRLRNTGAEQRPIRQQHPACAAG